MSTPTSRYVDALPLRDTNTRIRVFFLPNVPRVSPKGMIQNVSGGALMLGACFGTDYIGVDQTLNGARYLCWLLHSHPPRRSLQSVPVSLALGSVAKRLSLAVTRSPYQDARSNQDASHASSFVLERSGDSVDIEKGAGKWETRMSYYLSLATLASLLYNNQLVATRACLRWTHRPVRLRLDREEHHLNIRSIYGTRTPSSYAALLLPSSSSLSTRLSYHPPTQQARGLAFPLCPRYSLAQNTDANKETPDRIHAGLDANPSESAFGAPSTTNSQISGT
ncbi:hypothetical protein FS749_003009 [Ceratobasidium sp. UAMH 11750]|nr:hypothetical protein FS749_003009 [Ceratobasidium sp. UAMH 11750]